MRYLVQHQPEQLGFSCVGTAYLNAMQTANVPNAPTPESIAEINASCQSIKSWTAINPMRMASVLKNKGLPIHKLTRIPATKDSKRYTLAEVREKLLKLGFRTAVIGGHWRPEFSHAVAVHLDFYDDLVLLDNGAIQFADVNWNTDETFVRDIIAIGERK